MRDKVDIRWNPWIWICHFNASAMFHLQWCWCSCHTENGSSFNLKSNFKVHTWNSEKSFVVGWIVGNSESSIPDLVWIDEAHGQLVSVPKHLIERRVSVSPDSR